MSGTALELLDHAATVLLATVRAVPAGGGRRLMVVASGREALALWEQRRHTTVYADFGALSDGVTGARVARSIRGRCATTRVFLLSEDPRPDQAHWALSHGATGVIARKQLGIGESLAADILSPRNSEFPSGFPASDNPEAVVALVARRLNEAGLGPAASLAVEDARRVLLRDNGGLPFTARELARIVAVEIPDAPARLRFMEQFGNK